MLNELDVLTYNVKLVFVITHTTTIPSRLVTLVFPNIDVCVAHSQRKILLLNLCLIHFLLALSMQMGCYLFI